jgi:hypothetical protein
MKAQTALLNPYASSFPSLCTEAWRPRRSKIPPSVAYLINALRALSG